MRVVLTTPNAVQASVSIPVDGDEYFGRQCSACQRLFKMNLQQYESFPDDLSLYCPYCGERRGHSAFLTNDQRMRAESALSALAEQYVHQSLNDALSEAFSSMPRPSRHDFISLGWSYKPGRPPISRQLHDYLEDRVRRTVSCPRCRTHVAVFGATAFCPACGPRGGAEEVRDALAAQRIALVLEDQLDAETREQARAAGVFDQHAEGSIKNVVTLFETYVRDLFVADVPAGDRVLARERTSVFQNLDDTERLLRQHLGWDLFETLGPDLRQRLVVVFEKRHVLIHRNGKIDERYTRTVSSTRLAVGQRLVISRAEAERALNDLENFVNGCETLRDRRARGPQTRTRG